MRYVRGNGSGVVPGFTDVLMIGSVSVTSSSFFFLMGVKLKISLKTFMVICVDECLVTG